MELDEDDDAMLSDNAILAGVATANMDAVEESMQASGRRHAPAWPSAALPACHCHSAVACTS